MVRVSPKTPVKARAIDQKANRAFDTDYQNTTGRPLLVIVNVMCSRDPAGGYAYVLGRIDDVTPIAHVVGQVGLDDVENMQESVDVFLVFMVPSGWYYRVNSIIFGVGGQSSNTLMQWWEVEL